MNDHPIILFDGVCNFCNSTVNFVLKNDRTKELRFAPLQSVTGEQILKLHGINDQTLNTFIFVEQGKLYKASSAALRVAAYLPWYWKWTKVFWLVPRTIRDAVYYFIAKNRYHWFGKQESCMVPAAEWRSRFLN